MSTIELRSALIDTWHTNNRVTVSSNHSRETMSRHFVSNKDETVRMFRSDAPEPFTHVHPALPHLIYVPLTRLLLWVSNVPAGTAALLFLGSLLLWTLVEYVLHRFLFHAPEAVMRGTHDIVAGLEPGQAVIPKLPDFRHLSYFLMHGAHHEYPSDSKRLVMAPAISIPLAVLFWFLFRWRSVWRGLPPASRASSWATSSTTRRTTRCIIGRCRRRSGSS